MAVAPAAAAMQPLPPPPALSASVLEVGGGRDDGSLPPGIIRPPPDIREIVEKTAVYVARTSPAFEQKIRDHECGNSKFSFLNVGDPYYNYYVFRLSEAKAGRANTTIGVGRDKKGVASAGGGGGDAGAAAKDGSEGSSAPPAPPEFRFIVKLPPISAQDLDILRLTARYTAKLGRPWLQSLAARESRNSQFDFLRPTHSFYPYFNYMVEQYTNIIVPPRDIKDKLKQDAADRNSLLERVRIRVKHDQHVATQKQKDQEEQEREQIAYAQIDWHDFVVVETIEFTDADNSIDLPPPLALADLEYATLEQKHFMSWYEQPVSQTNGFDRVLSPPPPPIDTGGDDMVVDVSDQEAASPPSISQLIQQQQVKAALPIKPAVQSKPPRSRATHVPTSLCPRCKQAIPDSEMQEHMRIELLDPKWKEQKKISDERSSSTNLAPNEAAINIKRLQESSSREAKRSRQEGGGWVDR